MRRLLPFFLLGLIGLAGCGGDGSSPGSGRVGIFITDSLRDDYAHVWATIHKVELLTAAGAAETVFEDSVGRVVDLRSLRDQTGERFAFLSDDNVVSAVYNRVRVTVGPTMTLIPTGATAGTATSLTAALPRDGLGHPQLTFNLSTPRDLSSGADDVVIDFDLPNFTIAGGVIVPSLREGPRTTLNNIARHEDEDYKGVVSDLAGTAPDRTFTLTMGAGVSFTVATDTGTAIFNESAAGSPAIQNGSVVEVRGRFDIVSGTLMATAIKLENEGAADEPEITGTPSNISASAGTFDLTVEIAEGFVPTQTTVHVATNAGTIFRGDSGVNLTASEFFSRLGASQFVEVEGSYNSSTNTVTARRAKLEDEAGGANENEAEARGKAINVNASAGSFQINPVSEFEGFTHPGGPVSVTTNPSTQFKDADGNAISASAFFASLPAAAQVKVHGTHAGGTLAAERGELRH